MHILEIPSFFTPYGGEFCLDQAKALAAMGHEVRIVSNVQLSLRISRCDYLTLPYGRRWTENDGIPVYQSLMRGFPLVIRPNVERWVRIVRSMFADYVRRHGCPDVLHAHCAKWGGYAAMLISQEYGVPYVITEHLPLMLLRDEFGPAPSDAWQIPLLRSAYHAASCVIPVSEELVDDVACYYGKDYRWEFVSNTIDTDFFAYRQRPSRQHRPFVFCCLADFYYRKGYDILLPAFNRLLEHIPNAMLHVAGLNTKSAAFRRLVVDNGVTDHVVCHGRVNKQGVRELLYQSDALVLPSRSEVQPLVLLEAMSTGIPVVSTECVPKSERIDGGCFIVPVADVEALARQMTTLVQAPAPDGRSLSATIARMASPEAVGFRLHQIFVEVIKSKDDNCCL